MQDQATLLRKIVQDNKKTIFQAKKIKSKTKVYSIISGKGGVGKTNTTVNMAIALAMARKKILIVDADFGLSNVDVLLGINTHFNITHVLNGEKSLLDVLVDGPSGIKILPSACGARELVSLNKEQLNILSKKFEVFDNNVDYVLFDSGAGIGDNVVNFALSSDEVIVVTTPDPTAITDAYASIKVLINENKKKSLNIVVNMVKDKKEGFRIFNKLKFVCEKFLSVNIKYLGYILKDDCVVNSIKQQRPFICEYPRRDASINIREIASKIGNYPTNIDKRTGIREFFAKFIQRSSN